MKDLLPSSLQELHRRSVWQVAVVYLVGGWAVYQVVLDLWEGIGLPDWVPPAALIVVAAGLPIVVATTLVQKQGPLGGLAADAVPGDGQRPEERESGVEARGDAGGSERLVRLLSWRTVVVLGLGAMLSLGVATTGYMGMRGAGIGPVGTLLAKGTVDRRDELFIASFESPEDEVLGRTAAEVLRTAFDMSQILRLPDQEAVANALERMGSDRSTPGPGQALELAVREGWELVVLGEIQPIGDGYVITARVVAAGTGEDLGRFSATARHAEDFVGAMNEIADEMHERIGASYKSIRQMPALAQVTTSSLEALKAYTEAVWAADRQGSPAEAIPLLERAIAVDSTFGAAYRKLAVTLANVGRGGERRQEALQLAHRYRDRMTPYERFMLDALLLPDDSPEEEVTQIARYVELYEQYVRAHPEDFGSLINLGYGYARLGRYEDAIAVTERAIENGDDSAIARYNLMLFRMFAGDLEGAERAFARMQPGSEWYTEAAGHLAMARAEPRRAHDIWHEGGVRPYWVFLTDLALGRFSEAEQHLQERTEPLPPAATSRVVLHWRSAMAVAMALILPDGKGEARHNLVDALREFPGNSVRAPHYLRLAGAFAVADDTDRARRFLEAGLERAPNRRLREDVMWPRAEILLSEGRHQDAIGVFQNADRGVPGFERDLLGPLGRAYLAAGDVDSGVAVFERLLASTQGMEGYQPDGWLLHRPLAHRALARIYDRRGESEKAARHYARLIEWWRDADPEVQPQVAEAERRLNALRSD